MKKKARILLTIITASAFVMCGAVIAERTFEYAQAVKIYDEAVALAMTPETVTPPAVTENETSEVPEEPKVYTDPYADEFANMDYQALKEINDEVIGWISIPGTKLSYPLLQAPDNDYYLDRAWNGKKNASGSIFMECRNSFTLYDYNTIVYGHRMGNSTMFGSLSEYKNYSYWEKHPVINIINEDGKHSYLIFAAYEADVTDDTFRVKFETKKEQQDLIDHAVLNSVIDTGVVPTTGNNILTLSTCIGASVQSDTRWVVQAVKVDI